MITIEDFMKLELKVAKILSVDDHPNADKLYVIKIEVGEGVTKQICAGIKPFIKKEDLVNKLIVVVDNLQPALLRGVESQAMLLAAQSPTGVVVIVPEKEVPVGAKVR